MIITENPLVAVEEGDVKNSPKYTRNTSNWGTFLCSTGTWMRGQKQTVAKHPEPNLPWGGILCRLHSLSLYTPEQRIVFTFFKAM